jgi:hypothetical protein
MDRRNHELSTYRNGGVVTDTNIPALVRATYRPFTVVEAFCHSLKQPDPCF